MLSVEVIFISRWSRLRSRCRCCCWLALTTGGAGETMRGGRASTYRRSMWQLSNAQALIFVATVVVAIALLDRLTGNGADARSNPALTKSG